MDAHIPLTAELSPLITKCKRNCNMHVYCQYREFQLGEMYFSVARSAQSATDSNRRLNGS